MNFVKELAIVKISRLVALFITGTLGLSVMSLFFVAFFQNTFASGSIYEVTLVVIVICICDLAIASTLCLMLYHFFFLWGRTTQIKAIRLNMAMQLLHAYTHDENLKALKYYSISVFRTKTKLGADITDNVDCKVISIFLSPLFFQVDRLKALGSAHYCCDYAEIQAIIQAEQHKWGVSPQDCDATANQLATLQKKNEELTQKNKEANDKYTAASGREGTLKKQIKDIENHMSVLIELAHKTTCEVKPPYTLSRADIKKKYEAIGKLYGIKTAPYNYIELFRKIMPKEYINWGGAPSQGE